MKRSKLLEDLIKNAVEDIQIDFLFGISKHVDIFRQNGISAGMHIGCNKNG